MRTCVLLIPLLFACASPAGDVALTPPCHGKCDASGGANDVDGDGTSVCLAVRGNGPRITAHFGAIARVFEQFGLVDAVAGGSSGSITAFLVESVEMNPAVYRCGGRGCTAREAGERAAFLFKSTRGYLDALTDTDEALAFSETATLARAVSAGNIEALLAGNDPQAGVDALHTLLTSPELRDLVNPELASLLLTSPDPVFHARDLAATLRKGLTFEAVDPKIFLRPGVVNFPGFVERLGRIGTFYAGQGPTDPVAMGKLLDDCAAAARGNTWAEASQAGAGGEACGARFRKMLDSFRAAIIANPTAYRSRLDDSVGGSLPALVTIGVLEHAGADAWRAARASYLAGDPGSLGVAFRDVGVGYFGTTDDLALVTRGAAARGDLKSRMIRPLGTASWRSVLALSPAEPGLSRGVELPDGRVSVGGWSDLQPTLVLEDLGCDKIVYVTREGGPGDFERGIENLLGATAAEDHALNSLSDPASSVYRSLARANGVVCADWDKPSVTDLDAMTAIGYDAPFETHDDYFTARPYSEMVTRTNIAGCTLGVE